MLFNLDFAKNAILSCFLYLFLNYRLIFLIPTAVAQIFNPIAELVISTGFWFAKKQKQKLKYIQ